MIKHTQTRVFDRFLVLSLKELLISSILERIQWVMLNISMQIVPNKKTIKVSFFTVIRKPKFSDFVKTQVRLRPSEGSNASHFRT